LLEFTYELVFRDDFGSSPFDEIHLFVQWGEQRPSLCSF
jgi:hypothetical protein